MTPHGTQPQPTPHKALQPTQRLHRRHPKETHAMATASVITRRSSCATLKPSSRGQSPTRVLPGAKHKLTWVRQSCPGTKRLPWRASGQGSVRVPADGEAAGHSREICILAHEQRRTLRLPAARQLAGLTLNPAGIPPKRPVMRDFATDAYRPRTCRPIRAFTAVREAGDNPRAALPSIRHAGAPGSPISLMVRRLV